MNDQGRLPSSVEALHKIAEALDRQTEAIERQTMMMAFVAVHNFDRELPWGSLHAKSMTKRNYERVSKILEGGAK